MFLDCESIYILKVYSMHYSLKKTNAKKISFEQNLRYKKCTLFFFRELQLTTVLLLIRNSYTS